MIKEQCQRKTGTWLFVLSFFVLVGKRWLPQSFSLHDWILWEKGTMAVLGETNRLCKRGCHPLDLRCGNTALTFPGLASCIGRRFLVEQFPWCTFNVHLNLKHCSYTFFPIQGDYRNKLIVLFHKWWKISLYTQECYFSLCNIHTHKPIFVNSISTKTLNYSVWKW